MGRGALQVTAHGVAELDTTKQLTNTAKGRWLDGIIDSMDMRLSKFQEMVKDREA